MITIEQITKPVMAIIVGEEELRCIYDFINSKASTASLRIPLYETPNKKDNLAMNTIYIEARKYLSIHGKEQMYELGVMIDSGGVALDWFPITIPSDVESFGQFKKEVIHEFGSGYFYERVKHKTEENFDTHIVITTDLKFVDVTVKKE